MGLTQINFQSGIKLIIPIDIENDIITDVETETLKSEFVFLGVGDSINNYKAISKEALEKEWEEENETSE